MTAGSRAARASRAEWRVAVGNDETTAVYEPSHKRQLAIFVCAHGAGGSMSDRGMLRVAETLRSAGFGVVRFNFLYREKKSGRPDPMPRLEACVAAVVDRTRGASRDRVVSARERLFIGGKSMGGRIATHVAAADLSLDVKGLVLLGYPLHPPGRPEQLRDAHLPAIKVPVLCLSGTRDALCRRDLMEAASRRVGANWTMHWLEGADHSFHVLKSSGRSDADVFDEIGAVSSSWVGGLAR